MPAAEYGSVADSVTLCFSKGLGCPLGAVLAGPRETMGKAWRAKFLFGGAMRQAGMVAAAALYALDHHVDRLAEDHARARRLAEGLADAGLPVDPAAVETNFVGLEVEPLGLTTEEATERIAAEGVLGRLAAARRPPPGDVPRVEDADVDAAIAIRAPFCPRLTAALEGSSARGSASPRSCGRRPGRTRAQRARRRR